MRGKHISKHEEKGFVKARALNFATASYANCCKRQDCMVFFWTRNQSNPLNGLELVKGKTYVQHRLSSFSVM